MSTMQKHIIFLFCLLLLNGTACSSDTTKFNETRFQQLIQAEKTEGLKTQQAIDTEIDKNRERAVVLITNSFVKQSIPNIEIKRYLASRLGTITRHNTNKALLKALKKRNRL